MEFPSKYYLLQTQYDKVTKLFLDKLIDKKQYLKAVEYYESKQMIKTFTVSLN